MCIVLPLHIVLGNWDYTNVQNVYIVVPGTHISTYVRFSRPEKLEHQVVLSPNQRLLNPLFH
jgi:hypothetical protein